MATMVTDLDFETADWSLQATDRPEALTIVEFCSAMTRRLGLLAGIVPQDSRRPSRSNFLPSWPADPGPGSDPPARRRTRGHRRR